MALAPDIVAAIAQRLAEHAGLELPGWVIDARATARIELVGCAPGDYAALIDSGRGAGELAALIETVRVGESRLFRHRPQIDALTGVVVPALRGRRAIRVWSAGCAAGEEPYTLAIVLSRALPDCAISIIATDVSGDALAQAAAATYPRAALHHVPDDCRDAFIADGDTVRVSPAAAALVRFQRANLLDGAAPRNCDLVWCRNVLIYFTADARRRAIDRLVASTLPGGFIFVGYSESLRDIDELDAVRAGDAVYYVRRDPGTPRRVRPPTAPVPLVSDRRTPPPTPDRRTPTPLPLADDRLPLPIADRRSPLPLPHPLAAADDRTPHPHPHPHPHAAADDRTPLPHADGRVPLPHADGRMPMPMPMPMPLAAADGRVPLPHAAADGRVPLPHADGRMPPADGRMPMPMAAADGRVPHADGHMPLPLTVSDDRTPPPLLFPPEPPAHDTLALRGHAVAAHATAELSARLAQPGLRSLTVDLDGADLLDDDLAPILRRARAAAWTAGIALVVRATRTGARRWLMRHGLDDAGGSP